MSPSVPVVGDGQPQTGSNMSPSVPVVGDDQPQTACNMVKSVLNKMQYRLKPVGKKEVFICSHYSALKTDL